MDRSLEFLVFLLFLGFYRGILPNAERRVDEGRRTYTCRCQVGMRD